MNINSILVRLGIFILVYIGCIFVFSSTTAKSAHAKIFSAFLPFANNAINPNVYVMIEEYKGQGNFDVAVSLYNKKKFGSRLKNNRTRKKINPAFIINRNSYSLVLLPSLFLIALIIATPNPWKKKLRDIFIGVFTLYIFMAFFLGYRYETTMYSNDPEGFVPESLWDYMVSWIGGSGTQEYVYIVVVLIWAMLSVRPGMIKKLTT